MGLFNFFNKGKKKEEPTVVQDTSRTVNQQLELECPFCGEKFPVNKLVFALETSEAEIDQKRLNYYNEHYLPICTPLHHRLICTNWTNEDADRFETVRINGTNMQVPTGITARFHAIADENSTEFDGEHEETGLAQDTSLPRMHSTHRLCPHCHSILSPGCCTGKRIVIGLYGGKRSGKTTYMTMVSHVMERCWRGMGYGSVTVAQESKNELDILLQDALGVAGMTPTAVAYSCFPIVLLVEPAKAPAEPFMIILQDIPGELARNGDTRLVNRPEFLRVDAFMGIADINMITRNTPERKRLTANEAQLKNLDVQIYKANQKLNFKQPDLDIEGIQQQIHMWEEERERIQDAIDELTGRICTMEQGEVFEGLSFVELLKNVESVQIVLTKIDRLLADADGKKMLDAKTRINTDHREDHKGAINVQHLTYVDRQIKDLLPDECKNGNETILDWLASDFQRTVNRPLRKAYCAVASVRATDEATAGNAAAWQSCINILDPILNICRWKNLLPVRDNEEENAGNRRR